MQSKPLIIITVCTFFYSVSFAQSPINFGVKGGVNLSVLSDEYGSDASFATGPHFGGIGQLKLGENDEGIAQYALQGELLYSAQGSKYDGGKTTLSYLNVPVMIQRYLFSSGFYLETGPQVGFLLSAKTKDEDGTTNIKSQLKSIDFALNFGLGYQFNSGLGINARLSNGLTSVSKDYTVKNVTIGFGLVYIFGKNSD
jgi:hypothetical protein